MSQDQQKHNVSPKPVDLQQDSPDPNLDPNLKDFLSSFLNGDKYDLTLKTLIENKKIEAKADKVHLIWEFSTVALILGAIVLCAWLKIIDGLSVGILISAILGYALSNFKE